MNGRRYAVIVNPHGGLRRGTAVLDTIRPMFAATGAGLDIHTTARAGQAGELAQALPGEDLAGLCVIGGDGTVHEVVNGLMRRPDPAAIPIGIIPAGSGNDFARHLGVIDPMAAARRILAGRVRPLDVVRLSTRDAVEFCINIVGWGSGVDVNRRAEKLRWLGPSRYALAALLEIVLAKRRRARITLDGRTDDDAFHFVVACNTKFTGRGMMLAPDAAMDDGLLDVVLVRRATRRQMLSLFAKVFDGSHTGLDFVEVHRVRSFAIEPETHDALNLDGELKGATPVRAEVAPSALRIFAG